VPKWIKLPPNFDHIGSHFLAKLLLNEPSSFIKVVDKEIVSRTCLITRAYSAVDNLQLPSVHEIPDVIFASLVLQSPPHLEKLNFRKHECSLWIEEQRVNNSCVYEVYSSEF